MTRNLILALVATSLSSISGLCSANSSVYDCVIKTEYMLSDDGMITEVPNSLSIGDRFMVDRDSGRIIGKLTDNKIAKDVRVINRGDQNNSFIAMSRYWSGSADYLQINEYMPGSDKSFILVFNGFWVNAGICR